MGKGKGNPEYWVAVVKPGRILFEVTAMNKTEAKKLLTDANLQATKDFIAKNVIDNDLKVTAGAITDNPKNENKKEDYQNDLSVTVADFIKDME